MKPFTKNLTMKKNYTLFAIIGLFITTNIATAQTETEDLLELSLEQLMDISVVSASQSEEKTSNAPSTIYAVSREQIAIRGSSNLEELLEDIPEIEIKRSTICIGNRNTSCYYQQLSCWTRRTR